MTTERFRIAPPSRRQLLRKSLTVGVGLAVVPVTRTMATPVVAIAAAARQEVKFEERQEDRPMSEIMHLIKIRAAQDKVYQAVATAEGIRHWWTRDAALEPKIGGGGEGCVLGYPVMVYAR